MNRHQLICLAGLVATLAACNFPMTREARLGAIMATLDAMTPVPTSTLPATQTPDPAATPAPIKRPFPAVDPPGVPFVYTTRSGDTLDALARRFSVESAQILSDAPLLASGYLPIEQDLRIPNLMEAMSPGGDLLPVLLVVAAVPGGDFLPVLPITLTKLFTISHRPS